MLQIGLIERKNTITTDEFVSKLKTQNVIDKTATYSQKEYLLNSQNHFNDGSLIDFLYIHTIKDSITTDHVT